MFLKLLKSKWVLGATFALFCIFSPITLKASLTDFDGDGKVDFADFLLFVAVFGQSAVGQNAIYDLDASGTVDFGDFLIFATAFGQPASDPVRGVSTQGFATQTISNLLDCPGGRISRVGTITSDDGNVWIMPAETQYTTARHASDMYNQCTGVFTSNSSVLNLSAVPVVEIDQDGETITGYIFADNYFELYVNGTLIAVDSVPFTPFNSSMVRFKVKRPFTIAMKLVDWEENLGLGTEANRNFSHHPGDGGLVASFHDANGNTIAITNDQWKAQTFYIAPIRDLSCIVEKETEHLSGDCDTRGTNDGSQFYAMHYPVPSNWYDSDFDDSAWPQAYTYTNATVGVNNKPAYTNFTDLFDDPEHDAQFIWSSNLILDNEVIVRYTVGGTQGDAPVSAQAFQHFADRLNIQWDDDFLYIESDAFPDHRMMVGITAWNQQVPLPQPYQGDNAWQIPLKPAVADVPVYASQTLFRGAIGLAINGVPIFNPIKQDGRTDTYLAGELDEFGGHAGRADDYHYHIAPLFLNKKVGDAVPIAYALDGYPMYGLNEPDGTPAKDLDDLNGHFDTNGNYHYHSTLEYPYVNGGFKGVIELFRGEEVANQPRTRPVRPSGTGMRANITDFVKGTDEWYRLTYEANGGTYAIAYFLRPDGDYDFQFVDASGNITRQTYRSNGSVAVESDAGTSGQSGGSNDSGPQTVTDPPDTDSDSLFVASELLGRPTDRSITVNVVPSADLEIYLEYGTESGVYTKQTSVMVGTRDTPIEIVMEGLLSDTRYYYRTRYRRAGETEFKRRGEYTFHTYRPPGTTFTFSIQACAHLDGRSSLELYHRSLENVAAYQSDFLIDLGDTFMCNKHSEPLTATVRPAPDYATVERRYLYERGNFGKITHSIPLFLVNGNHDGEEGWSLNGTPNNVAVWATMARKKYYPNPVPDVFYSGDSDEEPFVGVRESYYSWSWGDALFVVVDPYWYTTTKPKRGGVSDNWRWTLGAKQYQWLRQVLEASDATFKFIFSHHLVGGIHTGEGRGGIEMAPYYEWGGKNRDDSWGFDTKRAGWYKPIHQLMVENNVSAFFHGHDHVFVKQELDGVVYQVLPQPSNTNYRNGDKIAAEGGYFSGTVLGNSGHLRVTVSPDDVVVEYIRAYLPGDEGAGRTNGEVSYSYRINKK